MTRTKPARTTMTVADHPRPAVSVILPAYDAEHTVREAVESVLRQSDVDLELLAVDDGSTDRTLDVLSSLHDPRLLVLAGTNAGPAAARNRGIARARGDVVAFIDADDLWLPGTLRAHLETFRRIPAAAVAYCWANHVDRNGQYVCPDRRVAVEGDVYREVLAHNFIDSVSTVAIRKAALDEVGGFDESLPVIEDWDLYVRLAARHSFVCTRQVLVHYRRSPGSLTSRMLTMEATYRRVVERAFAAAPPSLQHLKASNLALFYEYLTTKTSQGEASRENGAMALRFFTTAVRTRPANLFSMWRRPWVLKGLVKALAWRVGGGQRPSRDSASSTIDSDAIRPDQPRPAWRRRS